MKLTELIIVLKRLEEEGKGEYIVFDEGYMNEIEEGRNITVDDEERSIYL